MSDPTSTHVPVAGYAIAYQRGVLTTVGLGSCVAVMLWAQTQRIGAMAHVLLPHESLSRDRSKPAKFASTAIPFLLAELRIAGATGTPRVWMVGGASMFGALLTTGGVNMGQRNIEALRDALSLAGLRTENEDIGGDYGRSVKFDVDAGTVCVASMRHGERRL